MKEEKMGRTKGDEEGESWSRSTTEVLKETEKEEREMYMPPSPAKNNTATIRKDTIVSHQALHRHSGPPRARTTP
jgi:hypothetical protein